MSIVGILQSFRSGNSRSPPCLHYLYAILNYLNEKIATLYSTLMNDDARRLLLVDAAQLNQQDWSWVFNPIENCLETMV